jgi:hypothetical protein
VVPSLIISKSVLISLGLLALGIYPCQGASCSIHTACWLFCNNPPEISSLNDAVSKLRDDPNAELHRLAQTSALLLTPLGKDRGIRGWKDYCLDTFAIGTVVHSKHSWDGYQTVDISLDWFGAPASTVNLVASKHKFIRLELRSFVQKQTIRVPQTADIVEVRGHLLWDADGFLEVHPLDGGAIHVR